MSAELRTKHIAAVALGSNLGDREANLRAAVVRMGKLGSVLRVSGFYDTAPVGYVDQPRFLNAAVLVETELDPPELLEGLLGIEREMGRDRAATVPKGPRVIDLDLLLFEDVVMETPVLTLPHPSMRERRFVLEPMAEIAPESVDPITGMTMGELLARLKD